LAHQLLLVVLSQGRLLLMWRVRVQLEPQLLQGLLYCLQPRLLLLLPLLLLRRRRRVQVALPQHLLQP
jgi:hypothetical protein